MAAAKTDHERTLLERRISATDRDIDQLVYDLYGMTEEEISLVEGALDMTKSTNKLLA